MIPELMEPRQEDHMMKASLSYTKTQSQKENKTKKKPHKSGISKAAAVLTRKNGGRGPGSCSQLTAKAVHNARLA